jgi:hypothetical protein
MTLTIQPSPEAENKLLERAAQNGQMLEVYVEKLLKHSAQTLGAGQEGPRNHLSPDLRAWLCQQVNETVTVPDLQELRDKGGPELQEFFPDLEQVVYDRERTHR